MLFYRPSPPEVRWMLRADLDSVLAIDHTASPYEAPWTRQEYLDAIEGGGVAARVAEFDGAVAGVLVCEWHRDTVEVRRFAVRRSARRRGVGSAILDWIVGWMGPDGPGRLAIEVNEWNDPLIRFLARHGFRARLVPDGYLSTHEDAYRFTREVGAGQLTGPVGKGVTR